MTTELKCPMCDGSIPFGHRAHRGLLINIIASLQGNLITFKEQLASLQKKRWSKQFQAQRDKELQLQLELRARIIKDEELLTQLKQVVKECYGNQG